MSNVLGILAIVFIVLSALAFLLKEGYSWTIGLLIAAVVCLVIGGKTAK